MNEAQEGEGLGFSRATSLPTQSREPAKLDQPRLAFVKRHAKLPNRSLKSEKHFFRIILVVEANNEIVGIAHDHNSAAYIASTPLMNSQIEHVVQKDVGEERANASSSPGIRVISPRVSIIEKRCVPVEKTAPACSRLYRGQARGTLSIKYSDCSCPSCRCRPDFYREAGDDESRRRQLFKIVKLFEMAVTYFAPGLVPLPN